MARFIYNSKIQSNNQEDLPVLYQDSQKYQTDPKSNNFQKFQILLKNSTNHKFEENQPQTPHQ